MSNTPRYSLSLRILHWSFVLIVAAMASAGLALVESLEPWHLTLLNIHKSCGVAAFVLLIVRILVRFNHPPMPAIDGVSKWQLQLAHLVQYLLYGCLFLMPVSGYLSQYFAARPVEVFSLFRLPAATTVNIELYAVFREMHSITLVALIVLVAMHAGAALHHHFVRKDNTLKRML